MRMRDVVAGIHVIVDTLADVADFGVVDTPDVADFDAVDFDDVDSDAQCGKMLKTRRINRNGNLGFVTRHIR